MVDNEKHYLPKVLRKRDCYQNGNSHFCTIKRYDCLVGDQNDHQLKSVRYGWVVSGQLVHLPLYLKKVVSYGFRNPAQSDRGLAKCQVEVSCNTDRVNVLNLNTLTWVAAIHPMWSKCPHGVSRNAEGYSGE